MLISHHERGRDPLYRIWNCVDGNMILYVHEGDGNFVFQDRMYPLTPGALCLVGEDIPHYTVPDEPARYDRSKLILAAETVSGLLELLPAENGFRRLFFSRGAVYALIPPEEREQVEALFSAAAEHPTDRAVGLFAFFGLMHLLYRHTVNEVARPFSAQADAIAYINRHYAEPITIADVAAHAHVSQYHFCRTFKRRLGMTVMDYIADTRLAAAKRLLATDRLTISEIADKCGFSSPAYFCQFFKRRERMTPSAFRKSRSSATEKN